MTIDLDNLRKLASEVPDNARAIDGFPGYVVTPIGAVYSVAHNWRGYGIRQLKTALNADGYPSVRLTLAGGRIRMAVHRLVAIAFLPPRQSTEDQIRHLDGNKNNAAAENLLWGTAKENAADRDRHGRTARGSRNGSAKLTEEQVRSIRPLHAEHGSIRKVALLLGVDDAAIAGILRGKRWRHVV